MEEKYHHRSAQRIATDWKKEVKSFRLSIIKSGYPATFIQETIDEFENQENNEMINSVHWFDKRSSVGIRLPFCHRNKIKSRKFLRKLNSYTEGNCKFLSFGKLGK